MLKLGILLIVLSFLALPVAVLAAVFGFEGVAVTVYFVAKLASLLLIPGIVLVVLGARQQNRTMTSASQT